MLAARTYNERNKDPRRDDCTGASRCIYRGLYKFRRPFLPAEKQIRSFSRVLIALHPSLSPHLAR